jgi:glycosyltransferase involved in cell wall biosynthesis
MNLSSRGEQMSPKIAITHPGFPGQFGYLAHQWSQRPDWDVRIVVPDGRILTNDPIGHRLENHGWSWDNIYGYEYKPEKIRFGENKYLWQMEINLLHARGVISTLLDFKKEGWIPDIVIGHPGWLSTMYVKDHFPDATLVHFCEHMELYQPPKPGVERGSIGFDDNFPPKEDDFTKVHLDYMARLHSLNNCDFGVSPLHWQKNLHPKEYRDKISVIHEGIDIGSYEPFEIGDIEEDAPIITFAARSLEPSRGFHHFVEALSTVLAVNPKARAFVVGSPKGTYDPTPPGFDDWQSLLIDAYKGLPWDRVTFFGKIPHTEWMRVLQHSKVHVHFNHPGVLSWSCLEVMGQRKLVLGSDTGPVREVIQHGHNGFLFPYKDPDALAEMILKHLGESKDYLYRHAIDEIKRNAKKTVESKYSRALGLQGWDKLILSIMSRRANGMVLPQEIHF